MGFFSNALEFRLRVQYEAQAISAIKELINFDIETLSIKEQGKLTDSVINQMNLIGKEQLRVNDFIAIYFIHATSHVDDNLVASKLAQGTKNFLLEYKNSINAQTYEIVVEKLIMFLTYFKENLITSLGYEEGTKIYDQWFDGSGFLELLRPYLSK